MLGVLGQDLPEVTFTVDQQVVKAHFHPIWGMLNRAARTVIDGAGKKPPSGMSRQLGGSDGRGT
jgi:hypothetical protein